MLAQHEFGQFFTVLATGFQCLQILFALQVFTNRDVFHFRRNQPTARVVHLRHVVTGFGAAWGALQVKTQLGQLRVTQTCLTKSGTGAGQHFGVLTLFNPVRAYRL